MKIKVCVPFYSEFETAKPGLKALAADPRFEIDFAQGTYISEARNALVNGQRSQAIWQDSLPFDYFLFVDSDIGFTKENVEILLSHDKDIVCSPYRCHNTPDLYQAGMFSSPGVISGKCSVVTKGLHKVGYCGAGFMLVNASVFSKTRYPWFRHSVIELNGMASEVGEDIGFCMNVSESGLEVWCDFSNPVYHKLRTLASINFSL